MKFRRLTPLTHRRALMAGLAVIGLAALAVAVGRSRAAAPWRAADASLRTSGIIRADEIAVASEFGGRVAAMPVAEGDTVQAGQVLVQIDTALLDAQIEAAQAQVETAQAALALARAGSRPGQIAVAQAQLSQAQAARSAAAQAVSDLEALVANPQDINLQIAVKEAQLAAAQHKLASAAAQKDAAERAMHDSSYYSGQLDADAAHLAQIGQGLAQVPQIPGAGLPIGPVQQLLGQTSQALDLAKQLADLSYIPYWQGWIGVNAQSDSIEGLQASLANLYEQRKNPQELLAKLSQAKATLAQAEAQVAAAQAQLDGLRAGASAEQIGSLEARVGQAQAGLEALQKQRAMREIVAPAGGVVLSVVTRPGEVAAAGATLLTLADTRTLSLTVYVPETETARVRLGQRVQVTVDSFPGRTFEGEVSHIADQAEFTPRNISTKEERVNLVFAVEIRIANPDGALKPGMPADVAFVG